MKRNMDLIRELLLKLEALPKRTQDILSLDPSDKEVAVEGYSPDEIAYHLSLLKEKGLIECPGVEPLGGGFIFKRLTWDGHEYLDAIRDPEIWRKTKRETDALGAFTFELVKDLAKGFIKTKIEEHTGIKL